MRQRITYQEAPRLQRIGEAQRGHPNVRHTDISTYYESSFITRGGSQRARKEPVASAECQVGGAPKIRGKKVPLHLDEMNENFILKSDQPTCLG